MKSEQIEKIRQASYDAGWIDGKNEEKKLIKKTIENDIKKADNQHNRAILLNVKEWLKKNGIYKQSRCKE